MIQRPVPAPKNAKPFAIFSSHILRLAVSSVRDCGSRRQYRAVPQVVARFAEAISRRCQQNSLARSFDPRSIGLRPR